VGELIKAHTRPSDIACRYGGEEFLVVLPEISCGDALRRGEDLRRDIENLQLFSDEEAIHLTASIGIAFFPENGESVDEILMKADAALYCAKDAGRNKVSLPDEPAM